MEILTPHETAAVAASHTIQMKSDKVVEPPACPFVTTVKSMRMSVQ
jgi:hypothetical protein